MRNIDFNIRFSTKQVLKSEAIEILDNETWCEVVSILQMPVLRL